jgi:hypothetical protein
MDSMIPDTDQFQYNYRIAGATIYLLSLLLLLGYYFYTGYIASANSYYLATIDNYVSDSNGGTTCEYIPVKISGDYQATIYGNWETMPDFRDSEALYHLRTKNLGITREEYTLEMDKLWLLMIKDANEMKQRDLGFNLLLMMGRVYPLFDTTIQRFTYTPKVADVFKRDFTTGIMAGAFGKCEIR